MPRIREEGQYFVKFPDLPPKPVPDIAAKINPKTLKIGRKPSKAEWALLAKAYAKPGKLPIREAYLMVLRIHKVIASFKDVSVAPDFSIVSHLARRELVDIAELLEYSTCDL